MDPQKRSIACWISSSDLKARFWILDVGPGFHYAGLLQKLRSHWGFEQSPDLLEAARMRVYALGLANATLVLGNVADPEDVSKLPDNTFDLAFSRRGPNLNASMLPKLRPEAYMVQELFQRPLGLLEAFGRSDIRGGSWGQPKMAGKGIFLVGPYACQHQRVLLRILFPGC